MKILNEIEQILYLDSKFNLCNFNNMTKFKVDQEAHFPLLDVEMSQSLLCVTVPPQATSIRHACLMCV